MDVDMDENVCSKEYYYYYCYHDDNVDGCKSVGGCKKRVKCQAQQPESCGIYEACIKALRISCRR